MPTEISIIVCGLLGNNILPVFKHCFLWEIVKWRDGHKLTHKIKFVTIFFWFIIHKSKFLEGYSALPFHQLWCCSWIHMFADTSHLKWKTLIPTGLKGLRCPSSSERITLESSFWKSYLPFCHSKSAFRELWVAQTTRHFASSAQKNSPQCSQPMEVGENCGHDLAYLIPSSCGFTIECFCQKSCHVCPSIIPSLPDPAMSMGVCFIYREEELTVVFQSWGAAVRVVVLPLLVWGLRCQWSYVGKSLLEVLSYLSFFHSKSAFGDLGRGPLALGR